MHLIAIPLYSHYNTRIAPHSSVSVTRFSSCHSISGQTSAVIRPSLPMTKSCRHRPLSTHQFQYRSDYLPGKPQLLGHKAKGSKDPGPLDQGQYDSHYRYDPGPTRLDGYRLESRLRTTLHCEGSAA